MAIRVTNTRFSTIDFAVAVPTPTGPPLAANKHVTAAKGENRAAPHTITDGLQAHSGKRRPTWAAGRDGIQV